MRLTVIKAPLDRGNARPINWAAWQACGTIVPPQRFADASRQIRDRAQPRHHWAGLFLLAVIVAAIAVPMWLQVTQ